MNAGTYIVIVRKTNADSDKDWYCLGIKDQSNGTTTCCVSKFDPATDTGKNTWLVAPVPGADNYSGFFMQHQQSGLVACFGNSVIHVKKFQAANVEFLLRLDHVGNGWVAINNHSADLVMDAKTNTEPFLGNDVYPASWHSGINQEWRFINTALFTGIPL
jgi:hypothetical protein